MSQRNTTVAHPAFPYNLGQNTSPFEMVEYSMAIREYHVYISEDIEDPIEYVDLLTALRRADVNDTFYIYLNTPGGRLDTGLQLINAMHSSRARVVTVLDPQAYSMGALLFLSGKELIVPENSMLMFHNYSGGTRGKGNEQLAEVQAASRSFEKVMKKICQPFLSADEIRNILNGQDLWLDSDDILARLDRMRITAETEHPVPKGVPKDVTDVEVFTDVPPAKRSSTKTTTKAPGDGRKTKTTPRPRRPAKSAPSTPASPT